MARYLSERALIPWQGGSDLLPAADYPPVVRIPAAPPEAPMTYTETRTPAARPQSLESEVWLPGLQALLTAGAVGLAVGLLAWVFQWSWRVPVGILAASVAGAWLWRLRVADRLLWTLETWTGEDLNHDHQVGKPVLSYTLANPADARQAITRENRQEAADAERQGLLDFVDRCVLAGCGERCHHVQATGPARRDYVTHRDALMSLGIARWKFEGNPRGGWELAVSRHKAHAIIGKHVL